MYSYIFIDSRAYQEILGYQETQELKETRYVLSVFIKFDMLKHFKFSLQEKPSILP